MSPQAQISLHLRLQKEPEQPGHTVKTVKGLRFYPTCKLMCYLSSFMMLAEDIRLLGWRKMTTSHGDRSDCIGTRSLGLSSHRIIQQNETI